MQSDRAFQPSRSATPIRTPRELSLQTATSRVFALQLQIEAVPEGVAVGARLRHRNERGGASSAAERGELAIAAKKRFSTLSEGLVFFV